MTTTRALREIFQREYVATNGNLDAAVAAVATTVAAQLELRFPATTKPVELRVVVVHEYPAHADQPAPIVTRVLALAAQQFNVQPRQLIGRRPCKSKSHVDARWVAAAVLRQRGMSLPACGRAVGLRDHTTVIYGLRQIAKHPYLQAAVARVMAQLEEAPPAIAARTTTPSREIEAA